MKVLIGLLLVAHGLIHVSYLVPRPNYSKYPFTFDSSWFYNLVGSPGAKTIGAILAVLSVAGFVLAGLATLEVFGLVGLWRIFIVASSVTSLSLLLLFAHKWLTLGFVINLALLIGALQINRMPT